MGCHRVASCRRTGKLDFINSIIEFTYYLVFIYLFLFLNTFSSQFDFNLNFLPQFFFATFFPLFFTPLFQIVAVVVKYADNVMKGFATSISILISCLFSSFLFHDVDVNLAFSTGATIVLISVFAFGYQPAPPALSPLTKILST